MKRVWVHTDEVQTLGPSAWLDEHGFLLPEGLEQVRLWSLEEIDGDCAVLLGEPGMGKSYTLEPWTQSRRDVLFFDLGDFEEGSFESKVGKEQRLVATGPKVTLCLDSLDEAPARLPRQLATYLRALGDGARPRLRIACRDSLWARYSWLQEQLQQIYGEARTYLLAPLRWGDLPRDVQTLLEDAGAPEIGRSPIMLEPLQRWVADENQPGDLTRRALLSATCEHLLTDDPRRSPGRHTVEERLSYARGLAAKSLLTGKPPSALGTGSLHSETLNTALFADERFAHRSYAEYLAAKHLHGWVESGAHGRPRRVRRLIDLITHPQDPERHTIPQLSGLAGWLATLVPEVCEHLLAVEPEQPLGGDPRSLTDTQRALLVQHLVAGPPFDAGWRAWGDMRLESLRHTAVAAQVRGILEDAKLSPEHRENAAFFAYRLRLGDELKDALVARVCDGAENNEVRIVAGFALEGATFTAAQTTELLQRVASWRRLRGAVLSALWRTGRLDDGEILVRELDLDAQGITRRRNRVVSTFDLYDGFLDRVARDLRQGRRSPTNVDALVDWLDAQIKALGRVKSTGEALAQGIVTAALRSSERQVLLPSLARIAEATFDSAWKWPVLDSASRREVVSAMVDHLVEQGEQHASLSLTQVALSAVRADQQQTSRAGRGTESLLDFIAEGESQATVLDRPAEVRWVLKQTLESNGARRSIWRDLLRDLLDPEYPETWEPIADAASTPEGREALSTLVCSDLETISTEQRAWAARYELQKREWRQQREQEVAELRALAAAPSKEAWVGVLDRDSQLGPWPAIDRSLWSDLNEVDRAGIGHAAHDFLAETDTSDLVSHSGRESYDDAYRGVLALELLRSRDELAGLTDGLLDAWVPSILALGFAVPDLVRATCHRRPDRVAAMLKQWLAAAVSEADIDRVCNSIDRAWVPGIAGSLLERARFDVQHRALLLPSLLDHDVPGAAEIGDEGGKADIEVLRIRVVRKASAEAAWRQVLACDDEVFRAVVLGLTGQSDRRGAVSHLSGEVRRDLYMRLGRVFATGIDHDAPWDPQALQNSLLGSLVSDGEVEILRTIADEFQSAASVPHNLPLAIEEASKNRRQATWSPVSSSALNKILEGDAGPIRSSSELMERVREIFEDLQDELDKDDAVANRFRNDNGERTHKDEDSLSTELRKVLKDRLGKMVVADREVAVNPLDGKRSQSTDIKIEVPDAGCLIVEVKGSWNRELKTSLKSQLVGRYLAKEWTHGLYLVLWFEDDRPARLARDRVEEILSQQAREASNGNVRVSSFVLNLRALTPLLRRVGKGRGRAVNPRTASKARFRATTKY